MSLVFRPKRFRDKQGDVIEIGEMVVTRMDEMNDDGIGLEFAPDGAKLVIYNFGELQPGVQSLWEWGRISQGKNLSACLRDSIKMMECVREGHPDDSPPHSTQCEEKLARLKEELAKLEQQGVVPQ